MTISAFTILFAHSFLLVRFALAMLGVRASAVGTQSCYNAVNETARRLKLLLTSSMWPGFVVRF